MSDDNLMAKASEVQASGEATYTKPLWDQMVGALGRVPGGLNQAALAKVVASPDAVQQLSVAAQECMLTEMQNGEYRDQHTRDIEQAYVELRERQRENYRASRGRSRR